jgi:hypothetical protein
MSAVSSNIHSPYGFQNSLPPLQPLPEPAKPLLETKKEKPPIKQGSDLSLLTILFTTALAGAVIFATCKILETIDTKPDPRFPDNQKDKHTALEKFLATPEGAEYKEKFRNICVEGYKNFQKPGNPDLRLVKYLPKDWENNVTLTIDHKAHDAFECHTTIFSPTCSTLLCRDPNSLTCFNRNFEPIKVNITNYFNEAEVKTIVPLMEDHFEVLSPHDKNHLDIKAHIRCENSA